MTDRIQFSEAALGLILEALQDAKAFRDSRSHVMKRIGAIPPATSTGAGRRTTKRCWSG